MFNKLAAVEPVSLVPSAETQLHNFAKEIIMYQDSPVDDNELIQRIGDADAVLVSYTTAIGKAVIDACPNLRYIGMCCSLYSPESANVDISAANEKNITVTGIRDYGDPGVVEYVLSELIRYLHGFGNKQWQELPMELTDLKVGILGLGTTGQLIADALLALGSDLYYYSRTRKPDQEQRQIKYLPLHDLLKTTDVLFCCLNKNVILLHEEELKIFGNHKIIFNTSIGPSHDPAALTGWLNEGNNEFFCDTAGALGDPSGALLKHPHVNCMNISSGRTKQAFDRLSQKVLDNIQTYLDNNK